MKQITEDYVSYEIAKLLKEKGFNGDCDYWYDEYGGRCCSPSVISVECWCPSQSLALKWLREVYNIHIEIRYMPSQFTDEPTYKAMIWDMNTEIGTPLSPNISYTYFETCCEAAIKYTLENFI